MRRLLVVLVATWLGCGNDGQAPGPSGNGGGSSQGGGGSGSTYCCKHCNGIGKPCGDTCINSSLNCHTAGGCACF